MATHSELRGLFSNDELRNKVVAATLIAAYGLLSGAPTADDRAWFSEVMKNPEAEGRKAFMAIIAANAGASLATITNASDATISSQVDTIVPQLVLALAGA
jgi:hypothetical protein